MRLVSTDMLSEDMVIAKNIYCGECLVIKSGYPNIHKYKDNLSNMGIRYVYIEDGKSTDIIVPDVITEKTRQNCKNVLIRTIGDFRKSNSLKLVDLTGSLEQMISDISRNQNVQVSLMDISVADEYTFSHCVSTTVYALLIGKRKNYSKRMLEMLGMGTILHDLGKILLDSNVMFKEGSLTKDQFNYVKLHTTSGYEVVSSCGNVPKAAQQILLNHHEKLNGTGYPRGLKEHEIDEFSKIAAIADVYDALTSDRCYRKKWSTNKALDYLIENSGTLFDVELVRLFMQQIAIYPNGSMVRLSDGRLAIVKDQNPNVPLRPKVRVIGDEYGNCCCYEEVDLMEVLSLTIVESELEITESA